MATILTHISRYVRIPLLSSYVLSFSSAFCDIFLSPVNEWKFALKHMFIYIRDIVSQSINVSWFLCFFALLSSLTAYVIQCFSGRICLYLPVDFVNPTHNSHANNFLLSYVRISRVWHSFIFYCLLKDSKILIYALSRQVKAEIVYGMSCAFASFYYYLMWTLLGSLKISFW